MAKGNHGTEEEGKRPKSVVSECFTGAPDHFGIGNKSETFFVVPLGGTHHQTQSNGNGQQHKMSNGFAAFFQGSPPRTPKNLSQPQLPLAPSPLNAADYLDLDETRKENANIIRVEHDDGAGENNMRMNDGTRNGGVAGRKDSVRPNETGKQIKIGEKDQAQKVTLKNRPFKILVNDETDDNGTTAADYKLPQSESPLMMRRFQSTMEKVPESENERLYGEFEGLNRVAMCTLRPRSSSAELSENIRKNRFYDILPFEFNRVKLQWPNNAYGGTNGRSDFINASHIRLEDGNVAYIAAQGPIGPEEACDGRRVNTVHDFWEMIWQEQVNCVVMLTQTKEGLKHKCAQYWPHSPGETEQHGPDLSVHLYCVTEDEMCFLRELWLHRTGHAQRKIMQWHFKEWRDASGPAEVDNLLAFIDAIRTSARKRPSLVHCSAGVGRTGVFIALDILLDKLAKEHIIDVKETVSRLRDQRTNMVQNAEQYVALYEAIALAICRKSRSAG